MLSTSLWAIGFATMAAVLGLGIGMIARLSTAAVSGLLVWWLVVENLMSVLPGRAVRPLHAIPALATQCWAPAVPVSRASDLTLSTTENALVFGGYAAAALVIGTVLLYRRDTN